VTQCRAAVLGSPIGHSLSPVLHRTAYATLGLNWSYDAIDVDEARLASFIDSCGPEWAGLSLTMPLKTAVLPLLDDISAVAQVTGAANTVIFDGGQRRGDNTDVAGMVAALRAAASDPLAASEVAIIGGGATARSAVAAASLLDATHVVAAVRSPARAAGLVEVGERLGVRVTLRAWGEAGDLLNRAVVISTVPWGAADHLVADVPAQPGALLDVAYAQEPPALTRAWQTVGGVLADGLDLLLWQAVDQVRLMTGREPEVEPMRVALRAAAAG